MKQLVLLVTLTTLVTLYGLTINLVLDNHQPWSVEETYDDLETIKIFDILSKELAESEADFIDYEWQQNLGVAYYIEKDLEGNEEFYQYTLNELYMEQHSGALLLYLADVYSKQGDYNHAQYINYFIHHFPRSV